MARMLHIMLIVGVVHHALQVAFIIAHLHLQFKSIYTHRVLFDRPKVGRAAYRSAMGGAIAGLLCPMNMPADILPRLSHPMSTSADILPRLSHPMSAPADILPRPSHPISTSADILPRPSHPMSASADILPRLSYPMSTPADILPELSWPMGTPATLSLSSHSSPAAHPLNRMYCSRGGLCVGRRACRGCGASRRRGPGGRG